MNTDLYIILTSAAFLALLVQSELAAWMQGYRTLMLNMRYILVLPIEFIQCKYIFMLTKFSKGYQIILKIDRVEKFWSSPVGKSNILIREFKLVKHRL